MPEFTDEQIIEAMEDCEQCMAGDGPCWMCATTRTRRAMLKQEFERRRELDKSCEVKEWVDNYTAEEKRVRKINAEYAELKKREGEALANEVAKKTAHSL